jgi:hypothetical protein
MYDLSFIQNINSFAFLFILQENELNEVLKKKEDVDTQCNNYKSLLGSTVCRQWICMLYN